jgi:hypothetical protein
MGLIEKTKKSSKKGYKKKKSTNTRKDLSKAMCFRCHEMGHYASECPLKKGKGMKYVAVGTIAGVGEDHSQFETTFSMASCLSCNIVTSVGWYVDNRASRHMTYDRSSFSKF